MSGLNFGLFAGKSNNLYKKMAIFPDPISTPIPVFLAPLSGITDVPFRRLAASFGVQYVVSEMVASSEYLKDRKDCVQRAESAGITPHIVQLAGRDPYWMGEGARYACSNGADAIDINMGCPARHVISGASGSALMKDLELASRIITAVVDGSDKPVSLKMRLGWDDNSLNAAELGEIAEGLGVSWLTVHGRTRCQFYKGTADWTKIKPITDRVNIPVIANGDISNLGDAQSALNASGANAVMIGRGACGKPWIVQEIQNELNNIKSVPAKLSFSKHNPVEFITVHYEEMLEFYGVSLGVKNARKHLGWYLETYFANEIDLIAMHRKCLLPENNPHQVMSLISAIFGDLSMEVAA